MRARSVIVFLLLIFHLGLSHAQFFDAAAQSEDSKATTISSEDPNTGFIGTMLNSALKMLGIPYRWGGTEPATGFDCSGYVKHIFETVFGITLPRTAGEQSKLGEPISLSELKPGDLVFFNTLRKTFSHVGIYLGDSRFAHAPHTGSQVRVDVINSHYWSTHFTGARRILSRETFSTPFSPRAQTN